MDKKHVVEDYQRSGKNFVTFPGLLDEGHNQGLKRIDTVIVQIPSKENENLAIVQAEIETSKGTFKGTGDASPTNVGPMVAKHVLRMAETRAIARALRMATNIGETALEELGGDDTPEEIAGNLDSVKSGVNRISKSKRIERAALIEELRKACNFSGQISEQPDEKLEEIAAYLNENYG